MGGPKGGGNDGRTRAELNQGQRSVASIVAGTFEKSAGQKLAETVGRAHYPASVTQAELTLAAALGSATLTAIASLGVVWLQERRRGKGSSRADLVQAIETVLGKSMAITQRAQVWSTLAKTYSGTGDQFAVLLHARETNQLPEFVRAHDSRPGGDEPSLGANMVGI